MKIVACLLALTAVASADPAPKPPAAFVVPSDVTVPTLAAAKVNVGAFVLFQQEATPTTSFAVGRVTKVGKGSYTIAYTANDVAEDVPGTHVVPLDGKLHFGEPVLCDGQLAWYVRPRRTPPSSPAEQLAATLVEDDESQLFKAWVVKLDHLVECREVAPLRIAAFSKGAKVLVRGNASRVVVIGGGPSSPVEGAIVVEVQDGGWSYDILTEGGFTKKVTAANAFAP